MTGRLTRILAHAEARIAELKRRERGLERAAAAAPVPPAWSDAFTGRSVNVVAEVKRRSPSAGDIAPRLDAAQLATAYVRGGARALSVLTEEQHFGGSLADLQAVRRAVAVPVLRKDFILDPAQLLESRALGASAVLLIVRMLGPGRLRTLYPLAAELGLGILVEVHDATELAVALSVQPDVIGVNSRDLDTFEVDVERVARVLPHVPAPVVAVAESGLRSRDDIERVAAWGADAVLVGTELARSPQPEAAVRALTGVERVGRN